MFFPSNVLKLTIYSVRPIRSLKFLHRDDYNPNDIDDGSFIPFSSVHIQKSFILRISLVNVPESAGNCEFGHIFTEEIVNGKLHFFLQCMFLETITDALFRTLSNSQGGAFCG